MKTNSLIIAIIFTISPTLYAGPIKWMKENPIKCVVGIATGIGTMIYFSQSDNNTGEADNHSLIDLHPHLNTQQLLQLARQGSVTSTITNNTSQELASTHNRTAQPKKPCLKKNGHTIFIDRSQLTAE